MYPGLNTIKASLFDAKGKTSSASTTTSPRSREDQFQTVLRNTLLWVVLVPLSPPPIGLVYAVLVDRTRYESLAKTLIFLPMAISLVGASIIWKFVYEYRPTRATSSRSACATRSSSGWAWSRSSSCSTNRGTPCSSSR